MHKLVEVNINHQCYLNKIKKNHKKSNKSLRNKIQIKKTRMFLLDLELQSKMMTRKIKMMRNKINNDFSLIFICCLKNLFHYKKCEKNQYILQSILYLFVCSIAFVVSVVVNYFVKLHVGFNKLFLYLFLYFSSSIIHSEFINFIFPLSVTIKSLENFKSYFELLNKNIAKLGLIHFNPKTSVSFFLVVLLKKLIKVLETYFSNFLHCV